MVIRSDKMCPIFLSLLNFLIGVISEIRFWVLREKIILIARGYLLLLGSRSSILARGLIRVDSRYLNRDIRIIGCQRLSIAGSLPAVCVMVGRFAS